MGLKHLPLVNIVLLLINIFIGNYSWWGKLELEIEVPWLLVQGHRKMLPDYAVVIEVVSISGTWQNIQLHDVPLSHNNHKRNLRKECCNH